ncbi:hypothetical protein WA026_013846 [Henosepilachna vigintioctopunctata]|uniref:Uncharacterized protein n=1 Tax=Henosepilachna vigintioctopunctata TaxID=420089 RepID=A0AAW1UYL0_9CUCU
MSVDISKSDSDVSSNSSWTVIEDDQKSSKENASNSEIDQEVDIEVIKTTEIVTIPDSPKSEENDFVNISLPNQSSDEDNTDGSKDETKDNGFLTFDEYLQERMLEHDYEYPNQSVFKNKLRKNKNITKEKKKCKAEAVGVLSLFASLLTVTGIALLCLIFPESVDSNNFESIKSNYQSIANNDSLDYANIASTFNKTMEILDIANNTQMLAKCADSLMENTESQPYKRDFGPLPEIKKSKYRLQRRLGGRFTRDHIFRNDMCYPRSQNHCYESDNPKFKTDNSKQLLRKTKDVQKKLQITPPLIKPTNLHQIREKLFLCRLFKQY